MTKDFLLTVCESFNSILNRLIDYEELPCDVLDTLAEVKESLHIAMDTIKKA